MHRLAAHHGALLIIEDNPDSAESLKMYLELWGHSVAIALNGANGIESASANNPEVVICDVGLPGLDGYAVAAEIRQVLADMTKIDHRSHRACSTAWAKRGTRQSF